MDAFRDFSERHLAELRTGSLLTLALGLGIMLYTRRPQFIKQIRNAVNLPNPGFPLTYRGKVHLVDNSIILVQHQPQLRSKVKDFDVASDCLKVSLVGISLKAEVNAKVKELIEGKQVKFVPLALNSDTNEAEVDLLFKKQIFYTSMSNYLIDKTHSPKSTIPTPGYNQFFDLSSYDSKLTQTEGKAFKREQNRARRIARILYKLFTRS